jgi:hypothetical protein
MRGGEDGERKSDGERFGTGDAGAGTGSIVLIRISFFEVRV